MHAGCYPRVRGVSTARGMPSAMRPALGGGGATAGDMNVEWLCGAPRRTE